MGVLEGLKRDLAGGLVRQDGPVIARLQETNPARPADTKALAVRGKEDPGILSALAGSLGIKAKLGAQGALLNLAANALGLLEDEDEVLEHFDERGQSKKGKIARIVAELSPRVVISSRLIGGEPGMEAVRRTRMHNLASAFREEMKRSELDRAKVEKLRDEALSVLGEDGVAAIDKWFRTAQHRSGPRTDEERLLAATVVAQLSDEDSPQKDAEAGFVRRELAARIGDEILGIGEAVVARAEYHRLKDVFENPGAHVPGSNGEITLLKVGFWEQFIGAAFGVNIKPDVVKKDGRKQSPLITFDWRNLAGGSELTLKPNGSVWLRVGLENEELAPSLKELILKTRIEDKFENAAAVATRKVNLGKLSATVNAVATLWGRGKLRYPGFVEVQRSGAGERDKIVVRNVNKAVAGVQEAMSGGTVAAKRMAQIEAGDPAVRLPISEYKEVTVGAVQQKIFSYPRESQVLEEVGELRPKMAAREAEIFRRAGLRYPPDESVLKTYAGWSPDTRRQAFETMRAQKGDVVDEVRAIVERRAKKFAANT